MLEKYILNTACKNEADNLIQLIDSVLSQTITPLMWVIVDDGSTDDSRIIIQKASADHEWIHYVFLDDAYKRDLGQHLAQVVQDGIDYAISDCESKNVTYHFIGNLDADLTLPKTFFENLLYEFEKDSSLGIASGGLQLKRGDSFVYIDHLPNDEPSGGHMLIRKSCFEDCNGIPISKSFDSVLKAKARIKGWSTKRFEDNIATEKRDVFNAEGYWNGYVKYGESSYYLNFHPIHVFSKSVICTFIYPYYIGFAFLLGYLKSFILFKEKIKDEEIKKYFWNKWKLAYARRIRRLKA
ncbi:glycosyltransferase family 2 protein [Methanolobus sp. ZRKC5]|uniref:glycosyltransferase n=1 Tax=unclassified Methanolobus TaxID=2629569 RepID=UPI00313F2B16